MLMKALPLFLHDDNHPQATTCGQCEVRGSALFSVLDKAALESIHIHISKIELDPEESLYARDMAGSAVFTVRTGIMRLERVTESGDRRVVRLAGHGELIGQEALLSRRYGDDAIACTAVQLCRIPRDLIDELSRSQPSLLHELMHRWQHALDQSHTWIADLATGAARRRVLKLLSMLAGHVDDKAPIWLPRRDTMGAMLNMTVETASRAISQLRREGVIDLVPPHGAMVDRAMLAEALRQQDAR